MDKINLKNLSDSTFFDNDQGLINPAEHRVFNNQLIDFATQATFIVDSNGTLADWAQRYGSNDYSHVLIKAGAYMTNLVIELNSVGTQKVTAQPGSLITFTGSRGFVGTGASDRTTRLEGVNIQITSLAASVYAFENCSNLINCSAIVTASTEANAAFKSCFNLINCSGANTNYNASKGFIFDQCAFLTNCVCISSTTTSQYVYGFNKCLSLMNCSANITSAASGHGFFACDVLTNCDGCAIGGSVQSNGFTNCTRLVNCRGQGTATPSGYGFNGCRGMLLCSPLGVSKSGTHIACYMSATGTTGPVGATSAGGFNWTD